MFAGKMLRTEADYLIQWDVVAIKEALNAKKVKKNNGEIPNDFITLTKPDTK
jgi:hypothetical protein